MPKESFITLKHIVDAVDTLDYNYNYAQRFYYWINCALSLDGVIFISDVAAEEFRKRYNREPIMIDYPVLRYLYEDAALYAKPYDVSDLRNKIRLLWEDNDLNKEMSERIYNLFLHKYTREHAVRQLLSI